MKELPVLLQLLLHFSFVWIFAGLSYSSYASSLDDFSKAADTHPHSEKIAQENLPDVDYLLGLGSLQKIHGEWRHKESLRLTGDLQRFTYQISASYSVEEVLQYFENPLMSSAEQLFRCNGRSCGSSAQWASRVFERRELYGLDGFQYYRVYKMTEDAEQSYITLYAVKRANKRQYIHIDLLRQAISSGVQVEAEATARKDQLVFNDVAEKALLSQRQIDMILTAFEKKSQGLVVLAYVPECSQFSDCLARSQQWAEGITQQLVEAGIQKTKVSALGIGALNWQGDKGREGEIQDQNPRVEIIWP